MHSPDEEIEAEIEKEDKPQEGNNPQAGNDKPADDKPAGDTKPQNNAQSGSVESVIQQIANLKDYAGFEKIVGKLMDEMNEKIRSMK